MTNATNSLQFWSNGLPSWVSEVSFRLSKTGQSVLIVVRGRMHPDSAMPGGEKSMYVPAEEFASRPDICVNKALWRADKAVRTRFYGSHLVWTARNNFDKAFVVKMGTHIKSREENIYTSERAQSFVRRVLRIKGITFCPEVLCFPRREAFDAEKGRCE